jgi:hypothetical protein
MDRLSKLAAAISSKHPARDNKASRRRASAAVKVPAAHVPAGSVPAAAVAAVRRGERVQGKATG